MKKKMFLSVLAILSLFIVTGCSLEDLGFEYSNGTGLTITRENYNKISVGDSYSRVKSILGGECDNYFSSDNENWYTCIDDKDSSKRIVLKFINGKLEHKSSSGI